MEWARGYGWPGNIRELRHAIVRWVFQGGKVSLEETVRRLHDDSFEGQSDPAFVVSSMVFGRLNLALKEGSSPFGTLNDLVKEFERMVKHAVHRWFRETRPTDDQLKRIFPGNKSQSARNKIGTWGKL